MGLYVTSDEKRAALRELAVKRQRDQEIRRYSSYSLIWSKARALYDQLVAQRAAGTEAAQPSRGRPKPRLVGPDPVERLSAFGSYWRPPRSGRFPASSRLGSAATAT